MEMAQINKICSALLAQTAPEDGVEPMPTGREVGDWIELLDVSGIGCTTYWARLDADGECGVVSVEVGHDGPVTVDQLEAELDGWM